MCGLKQIHKFHMFEIPGLAQNIQPVFHRLPIGFLYRRKVGGRPLDFFCPWHAIFLEMSRSDLEKHALGNVLSGISHFAEYLRQSIKVLLIRRDRDVFYRLCGLGIFKHLIPA